MGLSLPQRQLVIVGALLFLIGLLQGAVVPMFTNPRMALSAHLTAVQSGTAVMVAGMVWSSATLSPALERVARWAIIGGLYGLWTGLTLSAATGASQTLPIAGAGYSASAAVEAGVSALVLLSSVVIVLGWGLFVVGLLRTKRL
jgi:(hydroxyamino)benzene mutase